jgi:hypothetical protein
MTIRNWLYALPFATLALGLNGCGGCAPEAPTPAVATQEVVAARDRAAEYALHGKMWSEAREVLAPLVEREDAAAEDLLRAANAALAESDADGAGPLIERAGRLLDEGDPVLLWCRFRHARLEGDGPAALEALQTLHGLRPDDHPTAVALVMVLEELDRVDEARDICREVLEVPREYIGAWRIPAVYRYARMLVTLGEDAQAWFDEYNDLTEVQNLTNPGEPAHQPGTLGQVMSHTPAALDGARPSVNLVRFESRELEGVAGARGAVALWTGWGDRTKRASRFDEEVFDWSPGPPAIASFGDGGVVLHEPSGNGWTRRVLSDEPARAAVPFDRGNARATPSDLAAVEQGDPNMDLLVATDAGARVLENREDGWSAEPVALAGAGTDAAVPVDFDHDGDVDLVLSGAGGARLLRNDGFDASDGGLTDVSDTLPLPSGPRVPSTEDLDGDGDVDLLFHDPASGRVTFLSNLRGGRFEDASASLPAAAGGDHVAVADFDGDGQPDLACLGDELRIFLRDGLGGWRAEPLTTPLAEPPSGAPRVVDWDLDGTNDLLWPTTTRPAAGVLAPGFPGGLALQLGDAFEEPHTGPATLDVVDLDGDRDQDLLRSDAEGLTLHLASGGPRGILFAPWGHKDNARAHGAIVETRIGLRYRRVFWRGRAEMLGTGAADTLELLRVTWPNAVVQNEFDLPRPAAILFWQRRGLAGSCPFLYTWNGTTYTFVSDVLGITPLGLPMAPGEIVPPDHDEVVLVRGDQLVPRDGVYELQFTEELREVSYLDRIRLDVVDHPADVAIYPNERFCFPPFPEEHTHTVRDPLSPERAVDGDGRDWAAELALDDEVLASPFTPLLGQFMGLATPHTIELAFDPERVRGATRLRLLLTGWLYWTDASVNVAAARHPEHAFVPPILQVPDPDAEGGWRDAGPPIGFPAGKLKTMVVDVTDLVDRDDPRLRLFSTLRLYWDSIRLAVDADDAPLVVTALEPTGARLWERGFSEPIPSHGPFELEWFEWDRIAEVPRWNQHPGLYTKLGETLPLVSAIDDRFVVMGAGDALTVTFDATAAPPLPEGWTRDYLVFLDGWAKDRDPNTAEALFVEPLPFHGMSTYPYGEDEAFPDTPAHRAWRREWQTRPARRWIESLVVPRPVPRPSVPAVGTAAAAFTGEARPRPAAAVHEPDPQEEEPGR